MQKFTQLPADAFTHLQLNAGIMVDTFTPSTGTIGNIMGATSGGVNFNSNPSFTDFGEDVDNCPANTAQLKHLDQYDATMSGTFLTCTPSGVAQLLAAADVDGTDKTKVVPRGQLESGDFKEVWWVGDYSDKNGETNGGFVAIHVMNALNTGGFQLQTGDKSKGQFPFEFTGHYSIDAQDVVPYEVYVKAGTEES